MKRLATLAIAVVSLGGAVAVLAQSTTISPLIKPGRIKIKIPFATPAPFKGKVPRATPAPSSKVPPGPIIGERFHVRVWAVLMPNVSSRNFFGTLKIDDQLRWSIPQEQASNHQIAPGGTLEISEDTADRQGGAFDFGSLYGNPRKVKFKFYLNSVQGGNAVGSAGFFDIIDLPKESGKLYKCNEGKGEVVLFVKVEHIGYVYGITLPHPIPTPRPTFGHPPPHRP